MDTLTITEAALFRYALPLRTPLTLGPHTLTERRGLLLRLTDSCGHTGWGEAAPLPAFSADTLDTAQSSLRSLCNHARNTRLQVETNGGAIGLSMGVPTATLPPSARMAVESAAVTLWCAHHRVPPRHLWNPQAPDRVAVNGLVTASDRPADEAQLLAEAGFTAIKLKVGRRTAEEEVAEIHAVRRRLPAHVRLRLDANRAWSLHQAESILRKLGDLDIEYVEEPLADPRELPELLARVGTPIALDETLATLDSPAALQSYTNVSTLVLKPTILGGLMRTHRFVTFAGQANVQVVISAAFESGCTIALLAEFAAAVCRPDTACGFDTLRRLERDILEPPLEITAGWLQLEQQPPWPERILVDKLQPVAHG